MEKESNYDSNEVENKKDYGRNNNLNLKNLTIKESLLQKLKASGVSTDDLET